MLRSPKNSVSALALAAVGLFAGSMTAAAADLGGDCCADLEERIAELEATTARKGNRKVSLTVYGQVDEAVLFWDDGRESNVYQVGNNQSSSRFGFKGNAKINDDVSAGYNIEIEVLTARSAGVDQNTDESTADSSSALLLRHSVWYIESKRLGRLSVGQTSPATDDLIFADAAGCILGCYSDYTQIGGDFFVENGVSNIRYSAVGTGFDTSRRNLVRYDSPTFNGAKLVAAWGEDDFWDVALWVANEWNGIKVDGRIGYLENTSSNTTGFEGIGGSPGFPRYQEFKGSASVLHTGTGLFVGGAFGHREFDDSPLAETDWWYVNGGIRRKLSPLGATVFYGQYGDADGGLEGAAGSATNGLSGTITSSELQYWGVGVVQHIDAAAMELYLQYINFEAEVRSNGTTGNTEISGDLDQVVAGARIKF